MCRATNETFGSDEDPESKEDHVQTGSSKRKRKLSFVPKQDSNTGVKNNSFYSNHGNKPGFHHRCMALVVILMMSLCASLVGISTYARQVFLSITFSCGGGGGGIVPGHSNIKALQVFKQSSRASRLTDMHNETNRPIATFLFLVGVEGSGHHLWRSVYSASPSYQRYRMAQKGSNLAENFVQMTRGLSSLFTAGCEGGEIDLRDGDNGNVDDDDGNQTSVASTIQQSSNPSLAAIDLGDEDSDNIDDEDANQTRSMITLQHSSNLTQAFDDVVRGMRRIKGLLRKKYGSKHNTAVAINAFFRKLNKGKFFSYPFGQENGCRTTSYPDLDLLYHACSEARVDCKHILITRDAYEVIRSTTVNRHFSAVGEQIRTMSSMLNVMRIQNVDHHESLAACWDFDAADGGGVAEMSDLLGWDSQEAFHASYSELLRHPEALGEEEMRAVVPDDLQELMGAYVQQTKRTADECQSLLKLKRQRGLDPM